MNILEFDNHALSAIILHPRKQKVELVYICNNATVIRLSFLGFIGFRTKPGVRHGLRHSVPVAYSVAYLWLTFYSVKIPL